MADNPGAGAPGDAVYVLRELLAQNVTNDECRFRPLLGSYGGAPMRARGRRCRHPVAARRQDRARLG
nr:MlrC C-terminal domain-containing protein [Mesorhizobium sp.]